VAEVYNAEGNYVKYWRGRTGHVRRKRA